ncbi:MAG: hypothetical protein HFF44_00025 [Lawsonibacter sp.]|nr:hypothetical protein [Lawsonibacter sp.]
MKRQIIWKRALCALLSGALLLSLAACGGNKPNNDGNDPSGGSPSAGTSGGGASSSPKQEAPPTPARPAEFTLDTTQVRLLCADGKYLALALFDCPKTDKGLKICDKSGNDTGAYMYNRYTGITLKNGLWLADAEEWPSKYSADSIGVLVTDNSGAEKLFTDIVPMAKEEMESVGLFTINGYATFAATGKIHASSSSAEFNVVVYMFCDGGIDSLENAADRFKFYTEDGTAWRLPLIEE